MGLGQLLTRNIVYDVTNTVTGAKATHTIITDGGPGMYPGWSIGQNYRGGMGIPAAWRLALLIANQLGRVPFHAYREVAGAPPVKILPRPSLLSRPVGRMDTALGAFRSWGLDRLWHGNGVGIVAEHNAQGWPTAATPVSAEFAQMALVGANDPQVPPDFVPGEIAYLINGRWYHQADVIHFKGPCAPGSLRGMGVLEEHFETMERSRKLDTAAGAVDSSAVPTGVLRSLNPDLTKAEAAELKASWTTSQRTRSVAVLNPLTEFTPIAWNPTETQLLESRNYSLVEWANVFGVNVSYAGGQNPSRVYANIVDQGLDMLRFGQVGDIIAEFEATLTDLLPRGNYVKANVDHLQRADTKGRYEAHAIAISSGFLTRDEVREYEERPPLTEEQKAEVMPPKPGAGVAPAPPGNNTAGAGQDRPRLSAVRSWLASVGIQPAPWQERVLVAELEARGRHSFNPLQPRDPDGKWGSGGFSVPDAPSAPGRRRRAARQLTNDEMAADYADVRERATPEQYDALNMYAGQDYDSINAYLRTGRTEPSAMTGNDPVAQTAAINELIGSYRTPGTVVGVRAVGRSLNAPPPGEAIGKTITAAGFQSVTMTTAAKDSTEVTSRDIPRNYRDKPIRLRMIIPPGFPAAVVQGMPHAIASEREILLPHGTRYVVSGDEMEGDKRWLTVTALPPR
jgi:HK97 family phage portal protein